jgi:hypothetical protein
MIKLPDLFLKINNDIAIYYNKTQLISKTLFIKNSQIGKNIILEWISQIENINLSYKNRNIKNKILLSEQIILQNIIKKKYFNNLFKLPKEYTFIYYGLNNKNNIVISYLKTLKKIKNKNILPSSNHAKDKIIKNATNKSINKTTENKSINKTTENKSINKTTENKSINKTTKNKSINKTTKNKSINKNIINKPINKTTKNKSINKNIINKPINKRPNKPINKTAKNKPINKTIKNKPINKTIKNKHINKTTKNKSMNGKIDKIKL